MLKIITPKKQKLHKSTISAFLNLLSIYQNFALSPDRRKKATFIVAEDSQHGVYGGAVLFPQHIFGLDEELSLKAYGDFYPPLQELWVAKVCLCLEINLSSVNFRDLELCKKFYDEIYEAIYAVGRSKGVKFLSPGFEQNWAPYPNSPSQTSFKGTSHA